MTRRAPARAAPAVSGSVTAVRASRLKRALAVSYAASFGALATLWVLFGLLIKPGEADGCTTGLYPGLYSEVLIPAHLAAFVVIAGATAWLAHRRRGEAGADRLTLLGIAGCALYAAAATQLEAIVGWPALIALIGVIPVTGVFAVAAIVQTAVTQRAQLHEDERWRRHAQIGQIGLWLALTFGLLGTFAGSYVNGAGLFCF